MSALEDDDLAVNWWKDPSAILIDEVVYRRPVWQQRAACRGQMTEGKTLWFGRTDEQRNMARRVCATCIVQADCRAFGLGQAEGVWGQ